MKHTLSFLLSMGILLSACDDGPPPPLKQLMLDYYVESFEVAGLEFQPQLKVTYEYDQTGKLIKYTVFGFNQATESFDEQRSFLFEYEKDRVAAIEGVLTNSSSPYIRYAYSYNDDGTVAKISENNYSLQLTSDASFYYDLLGDSVKVTYSYSNGGGFEYEFLYAGQNIAGAKTTRGAQLCNEGVYTYDQHVNPFNRLGYTDYLLTTLSVNNKLSEDVNYTGCAFPNLVPDSYEYEYNQRGYPTIATTFYSSGAQVRRSKKEFFYKEN